MPFLWYFSRRLLLLYVSLAPSQELKIYKTACTSWWSNTVFLVIKLLCVGNVNEIKKEIENWF